MNYTEKQKKEISQFNELDLSASYSYAHYLKWAFDDRVELIKGKVFKMSPAPARVHQEVSREISRMLFNYLETRTCKAYTAPFDVRLPGKSSDDKDVLTVVQPDICVICDPSKLDEKGCIGAPDIVVEILSPGNNKMELRKKYDVYESSGVKEYWIVWPEYKTFLKYALDELGKYQPSRVLTLDDEVVSQLLPGFVLKLNEVFRD